MVARRAAANAESIERIRDVEQIRRWREEKGMLALNFHTPDGSTEVDLLVGESDAFDALKSRAITVTVEGLRARRGSA